MLAKRDVLNEAKNSCNWPGYFTVHTSLIKISCLVRKEFQGTLDLYYQLVNQSDSVSVVTTVFDSPK